MAINDRSKLFGARAFPPNMPYEYHKRKFGENGLSDTLEEAFMSAQKFEGLPRILQSSVNNIPVVGTTTESGPVVIQGTSFMGNMEKAAVTIGASLAVVTAILPGTGGNDLRIAITDGGTGTVAVATALGITTITFDANLGVDTYNTMATAINTDASGGSYANRLLDVVGSVTVIAAAVASTALTGGEGTGVDVVHAGTTSLMVDNAAGLSCSEWTDTQITLEDTPATAITNGVMEVYVNGVLATQTYVMISNAIPLSAVTGGGTVGGYVVTWGVPSAEGATNPNQIDIAMTVTDIFGNAVTSIQILRLTSETTSTMALLGGGEGTVLDGAGTGDMLIATNAAGLFNLALTYTAGAGTIDVAAGITQGSALIDCSTGVAGTFA